MAEQCINDNKGKILSTELCFTIHTDAPFEISPSQITDKWAEEGNEPSEINIGFSDAITTTAIFIYYNPIGFVEIKK